MTQTHRICSLAQTTVDKANAEGVMIAAAESCTGGLISAALTDVPGSSAIFERGFITYSNDAKCDMLGVQIKLIENHGAVSAQVARAMAEGAVKNSCADIAVSVTGIAGPTGGTDNKPVGLVWFGLANRNGAIRIERRVFTLGSRDIVRAKATETALRLLLTQLSSTN